MKYTIERTECGCIEVLEINGKTYKRASERICCGLEQGDEDFGEQLYNAGFDEGVCDRISDLFDGCRALEFVEIDEIIN